MHVHIPPATRHSLIIEEGRLCLLPLFYKQETIPGGVSTGKITEVGLHVTLVDLPGCLMVGDMDRLSAETSSIEGMVCKPGERNCSQELPVLLH